MKQRQILSYNLHGLHLQFLCKPDPEGAFAHASWDSMRPQWQTAIGSSIGWSILPVRQASLLDGGFVPLSYDFVGVLEEPHVKNWVGFSMLSKKKMDG